MLYLYIDESGDLGFDFINHNPSKFFTIAILAVKRENHKILTKAIEITKRRKFNIKKHKIEELKGSKCPLEIKKYFYNRVKDIDFKLYAITLNKIRVYEKLRKDKEKVYNFITRLVLDKIPFNTANSRIEIIIDRSKTKKNIFEFNQYILQQIKNKFAAKIPFNIYHHNSKQSLGLQTIDLFCWGIFKKYEAKDLEWYNIFKEKITYDKPYL